jgi:hypothetical protein
MVTLDLLLYRRLQEELNEQIENRVEMLSSGSCQTIEEYKYQVGYIKGVKDALIWAKEINEKLIGNTDKAR